MLFQLHCIQTRPFSSLYSEYRQPSKTHRLKPSASGLAQRNFKQGAVGRVLSRHLVRYGTLLKILCIMLTVVFQ